MTTKISMLYCKENTMEKETYGWLKKILNHRIYPRDKFNYFTKGYLP
jgi:hypothetical protein